MPLSPSVQWEIWQQVSMDEAQRRQPPCLNATERGQNEKIGSYKKCLKTVLSGVQENIKLQLKWTHSIRRSRHS